METFFSPTVKKRNKEQRVLQRTVADWENLIEAEIFHALQKDASLANLISQERLAQLYVPKRMREMSCKFNNITMKPLQVKNHLNKVSITCLYR